MATLTKSTGTVTLTGAAEKVTLPAVYGWVWLKNMSDSDILAGLSVDISEGADGVMTIPAGECGRLQTDGFDSVYLMGLGNALVVAQNYADCPFKTVRKGGESGDKVKYISDGLIKAIALDGIVTAAYILIQNAGIVLSEEMTIECCAMYSGFVDISNKGRFFALGDSDKIIGMSMYNNVFEAAVSTDTSMGWAIGEETNITVEPNEFVTLAMTSDSSGTKFYKNGILHGSYEKNVASIAGDTVDNIGVNRDFSRNDRNIIGNVYMLRFYDRILSTYELRANTQADINNYCKGLKNHD